MDSRIETYKHIQQVRSFLSLVVKNLLDRMLAHDQSKLQSPEVEAFDEFTPKLAALTYGSEEYKSLLEQIRPALEHHYAANRHHPEHFKEGIKGMTLLDLVEMLCDWKAATLRHNDGCIKRSVEINQKRFAYSDELKQILLNTITLFEV